MIVDKNTKSLEEGIYQELEEEILSGALRRGDTLTENSVTARLGASRTPVRSALHRLAEEAKGCNSWHYRNEAKVHHI